MTAVCPVMLQAQNSVLRSQTTDDVDDLKSKQANNNKPAPAAIHWSHLEPLSANEVRVGSSAVAIPWCVIADVCAGVRG
jgi:hypothetical protein